MDTVAVVLEKPEHLVVSKLDLSTPGDEDVVVDIDWSGISTGTERLLWSGKMPPFPGMGYPLVPGYESVGKVVEAGSKSGLRPGENVFVPGARCFGEVKGLFGGAASRLVVAGERVTSIDESLGPQAVLLALAATAYRAVNTGAGGPNNAEAPELIVGHGVLGRLIARIALLQDGPPPTVWELDQTRSGGATGYEVLHPDKDSRTDYSRICDVSGAPDLLDSLIARLAPGGEIVLAGFYSAPLSFAFPPAFMREAKLRISAEWRPADLAAAKALIESGRLSLDGLITHREDAFHAPAAYRTAFSDPACLKMILDWRPHS